MKALKFSATKIAGENQMWRFVLPALAMMGALLVLFAGALGDLRSWPEVSRGATSIMAAVTPDQAPSPVPSTPSAQLPAPPGPAQQAASDASQRQVSWLQQQASVLQTQIDQRKQELDQRTQEVNQIKQQLSQSTQELNQRTQDLNQRKQQIAQQSHEVDALRGEADKLRKSLEALHQQQQRAAQEAAQARQKTQDQQLAVAIQSAGANQSRPSPVRRPGSPDQQVASNTPAMQPMLRPSASQQLMTARQWLAAGRPEQARRVLAVVQTQMVFQPVTPDQPVEQEGNASATYVGDAIRWLDRGANGQAMAAINRAIAGIGNGLPNAWAGYPAEGPSSYVQTARTGYYSDYSYR